jgi:hypothetical protein
MSQINEKQKKFVMGLGIVVIIGAIVLTGVAIGRGDGLPVAAPLLIIVGLLGIILANKR